MHHAPRFCSRKRRAPRTEILLSEHEILLSENMGFFGGVMGFFGGIMGFFGGVMGFFGGVMGFTSNSWVMGSWGSSVGSNFKRTLHDTDTRTNYALQLY